MKRSSSELKRLARSDLSGHYGLPIAAFTLYTGITFFIMFVLELIFPTRSLTSALMNVICSIIINLLLSLVSVGYLKLMLNISRGQIASLKDLFYCFSVQPDRVILLTLLMVLMFFACFLPAIILVTIGFLTNLVFVSVLGILAALAGCIFYVILMLMYSQIYFLYLDHPDAHVMELMRESRRLMQGNKGRLFYLNLSFIGLALLSVLTCYIGMLWLVPYMEMTIIKFYQELIDEL